MVKKFNSLKFDKTTIAVIVGIKLLLIGSLILIFRDVQIEFEKGTLITFDATASGGKASAQGVAASTSGGNISSDTGGTISSENTGGGGGSLSADMGGGGFQSFSRDIVTTFTNSHSVGKGQSTNGLFKVDWNHNQNIKIQDIDFGIYSDIVKANNPPITLEGKRNFGQTSEESTGNVGYILNIPSNFELKRFQIPVSFIVESNGNFFVGNTSIDVTVGDNFNLLEFLRSLLTGFKLSVTESSVL